MRIREKGICAGPRAAGGVTRWRLLLGGGHVDAEGGEDDSRAGRMGELRFIDNSAGNGGGDLDQQERADQVHTAATETATLGRNAPVAIEAAIALAVSWKPLVNSKPSAVTTTT